MKKFWNPAKGFTLIELLIVVAIIAILAAIAVPNFLEAQTRAKVSRVKTDLRTLATALESYKIDTNWYPPTPFCATSFNGGLFRTIPSSLSTPIAYLSTAGFYDPFLVQLADFQAIDNGGTVGTFAIDAGFTDPNDTGAADPRGGQRYYYTSNRDPRRSGGPDSAFQVEARELEGDWLLMSVGPDEARNLISIGSGSAFMPYDPTNGTVSDGDIMRSQRFSESTLVEP